MLIANRGEIARRIARTARERGITCVAVYSDPDRDAAFVHEADLAVSLGGRTSAESYLDAVKVLAAARLTGCDAVHPGYGFLSENAAFAAEALAAGLIWIGPPPAAISAMAEKVPAKRLVAAAGVPLVPGAELEDSTDLAAAGAAVGYPLMIKASSGGGGKGMRVVADEAELAEAVATARREAGASFGDATVFLERYLPEARHIEVQVFGDSHGRVVHLFERECSIQRRHQKVIEEAPAAFLPAAVRTGLHGAAVAAAEAVGYVGAGTVEFLVDGEDYYFLEMNTRLQVEHPVTEAITGLDLVGWQFDVAEGKPLPDPPAEPNGHAIEARLYAEDVRHGDLPSTGTVTAFDFDSSLRVDSGVEAGSEVSPFYDPMLAKVISHASDRDVAAAVLARGLRAGRIHGVVTNRDLLVAVLESQDFLDQPATTAFLDHHAEFRSAQPDVATLAAHALAAAAAVLETGAGGSSDPVSVVPTSYRNVQRPDGVGVQLDGESAAALHSSLAGAEPAGGLEGSVQVRRRVGRSGGVRWGFALPAAAVGQGSDAVSWTSDDVVCAPSTSGVDGVRLQAVVTDADGLTRRTVVSMYGGAGDDSAGFDVYVDDPLDHTTWRIPPHAGAPAVTSGGDGAAVPVPGTVTAVLVEPGDVVSSGQALVLIEAMKMEHKIAATGDGIVAEVLVSPGQSVEAHQVVVRMADQEDQ
ncbi:MAG: acetyl/propionyl/methylcrotonyl-CoA carboxylase subunit alpha [Candidatus Nanopelagicales bacterium]